MYRAERDASEARRTAVAAAQALTESISTERNLASRAMAEEYSRSLSALSFDGETGGRKFDAGRKDAELTLEASQRALEPMLEAKHADAHARVKALEALVPPLDARALALQKAQKRPEGLAPWDHEALDARRAWEELPPETEADGVLLRGSEVEALFHEHLGISRTEYYRSYRALLRTHHLGSALGFDHLLRGGGATPTVKSRRWLREEVKGLIRFIQRLRG